MKVVIFGQAKNKITNLVKTLGLEVVEKNPEFIISIGGDGTLMRSEVEYPGIPKIILKESLICKKCSHLPNEEVLKRVLQGRYKIEKLMKLEIKSKDKSLFGINDIVVHNQNSRHAIRYELFVDGKQIGKEIIGDGIVVATPAFGSTGYYRSITDSFFEVGIGLAFNNSTEQSDHMVLEENRTIKIQINRGPAIVYADNQEESLILEKDDSVEIKKSNLVAKIVVPYED